MGTRLMSRSLIVITGATGYIGSQVLRALLSAYGSEISCRVLVRQGSDRSVFSDLSVEIVEADLLDATALHEAFAGADTVFHCAGLIAYTWMFREKLYETNVLGTRNVVDAALFNNVRRMVLTSSVAALGMNDDGSVVNESTTFQEWQRRNGYMEAKHLTELEGLRGVAEGLEVVMVNPGVVIGIDAGNPASASSSNDVLKLLYQGRVPLLPIGGTGFVDVRDVAAAHLAAWKHGVSGERYALVAHNLSFRNLFDALAARAGSRAGKAMVLPRLLAALAAFGGEAWSLLLRRPSFISFESIRIASKHFAYDNRRSVTGLQLSYRTLSETLDTIVP